MADKIEPALTPEDWQRMLEDFEPAASLEANATSYEPDFFMAMAVANAALPDGDPRKITHEDIARLREVINDARIAGNLNPNNQSDAGWERHQKRIDAAFAVAAKLAALLPPQAT